jgi:hypothetical protein
VALEEEVSTVDTRSDEACERGGQIIRQKKEGYISGS